eukprot:Protomagalhaensia_sp_Gyna_25__5756@NODE_834_length_2537_cov_470_258607_g658_i0_p2_GENE_NODE_834_length_2537_cov_470_258607_g658_i0NODE_834_length_2537_cov_470_258607_g658_i0_p2_ORF_typecomplete_len109_score8_71Herpes_LMP1/PF05297_11/0_63_NODE_834_length_2537_cov_470_258607_g658_i021432469
MKLPLLSCLWVLTALGSTHDDGHNHVPVLAHPKGLTADRESQGALALNLPPGYDDDEAESAFHHAPLLHHPQGLTADRKSQGALNMAAPVGSNDSADAVSGLYWRASP